MELVLAIISKYGFPFNKWALLCIKLCWGVFEPNSIVNSVRVNDWTAKWTTIVGTDCILPGKHYYFVFHILLLRRLLVRQIDIWK